MGEETVKTATFKELWTSYPRGSRDDLLHTLKGGLPDALKDKHDDSAFRLSAAFNRTGHSLPKSTMYSGVEIKDCHGFKYMTDFDDMKHHLTSKLGKPRHMKDMSHALGRKGIVIFEGVKSLHDSHGHVDLWDGQQTTEPSGMLWNEAKEISLWELKDE